ncbi:sushi, von Willebrand factor type A, EGF and pentraxin domain-containing protein 1-like [Halichondria panicea]|uniref:sushi, von Willebrand factor type A, EGF and pentraxin domain-containing protein 1-like n=1 Tax=Halichondria panicea TaxID=6063 RepID=UPI00312BA267
MIGYNIEAASPRPVDTVATYTCVTGYTLNGNTMRTCMSDGVWSGSAPVCQQKLCSDLTLPNGNIVYSAGSPDNRFIFSTAMYSCNPGYTLIGGSSTRVVCMIGGIWSGSTPNCEAIACPPLLTITNGMISYFPDVTSDYDLGTEATYTCEAGFYLEGNEVRVCMDDDGMDTIGVWSGQEPSCVRSTAAPPPSCSDLTNPTNGMIGYNIEAASPRPVDTVATYTCVTGYTLNGNTMRTCMSDGVWSGSAPVCQQKLCSDLTLPNGNIVYSAGSPDNRFIFSTAMYNCNPGYILIGGSTRVVCVIGGIWSGSISNCEAIECPPPLTITNGMISYSPDVTPDYDLGTEATYTCEAGFYLEGNEVRVCMDDDVMNAIGVWSSQEPSCVRPTAAPPTTCSDLIIPTNGMIGYNIETASPRPVDTMATYICDTGYTLNGETTRTCGSDGVWSGSTPVCQQKLCSDLTLTNGNIVYSAGSPGNRLIFSTAIYSCNPGYTLTGGSTRVVCVIGGIWSGSTPNCEAIMCPSLLAITNGIISYSPDVTSDYDQGTEATYTCEAGFYLEGNEVRVCMDDDGMDSIGVWSGSQEPSCVSIQCPPLNLVPNGFITYAPDNTSISSHDLGTVATYSCNTGFVLDFSLGGSEMRTCMDDMDNDAEGVFDRYAPRCIAIQCLPLDSVVNGVISYAIDIAAKYDLGTVATYDCDPGFVLDLSLGGSEMRPCVDDNGMDTIGVWSGQEPSCVPTRCAPLMTALDNGIVTYSNQLQNEKYIFGTLVTYICSPGYGLSSTQNRTCITDGGRTIGIFNGSDPTCDRITCSALPDVMNGTINYSSGGTTAPYDYETTATYHCNLGHVLTTRDSEKTCTGDGRSPSGQWDGAAPQCPPVDCRTPPSITNGFSGIPTTTTFTGTMTYSCNDGYALFGIATSTCQANATWSRSPKCRGITIGGIQSGVSIYIGDSVTITCTTDSPADSVMLLQDDQPLHETNSQTTLMHNISVTDSINGNIFKCEANLTGRTYSSDTTFDMVTISIKIPEQPINASIRTSSPSTPLIGQLYNWTCTVSLFPGLTRTPTAQWLKVTMGEEINNLNRSTLNFSPLRTSDAGRYRCQGNVSTTVHSQSLSDSNDIDIIVQIPTPSVTIMRSVSDSALFANQSVVTFTCQVSVHKDIDTPVTLSLTWTREVYNDENETTTEFKRPESDLQWNNKLS